jgi:spore coat protein A
MIQIGADGGLFEKKVTIGASKGNFDLDGLKIAPGMRADLLIDFSKFKGQNLILKNNYKNALVEPVIGEMNKVSIIDNIMQFRVGSNVTEAYQLNLPAKLRTISKLSETEQIVATKDFLIKELDESMCITKPAEQIKGSTTFFGLPYRWQLIDEEKTLQNTTEIWRFINLTGDPHPIHIHQGSFQVVAREKVDMKMYEKNKNLHMLKSSRRIPEKNELGFRDIAMVYPGETLEIAKKFYIKGKFLYHCHILEHEDMGMMRFFEVN